MQKRDDEQRERPLPPPLSLPPSLSFSLPLSPLSPPPSSSSLLSLSDLQLCSESWGKDAPLRLFFILIYLNLVFIVNQTVHTDPLGPIRSGPVRLGCAVERSGTMRLVVWRRSDGRRLNVNLQLLRAADSFPSFMRLLQAQNQTRTGLLSSILQTEAGGWGVEELMNHRCRQKKTAAKMIYIFQRSNMKNIFTAESWR